MVPQTHTNSIAQHGVYGEPPPSIEGLGGTMHPSYAVTNLLCTGSFTNPLLEKKTPDLGKKSQASNAQAHYTFDVTKTEEKSLVKEKFITFP